MSKVCQCGAILGKKNRSGQCRACIIRRLNSDPSIVAARTASMKRSFAEDPAKLEAARQRIAAAQLHLAGKNWLTPEKAREIGSKGNAARPKGSAVRMRAGIRQRQTKLDKAGIPLDAQADYLHLTLVKRVSAAEAREMAIAKHEREMALFRQKLEAASA